MKFKIETSKLNLIYLILAFLVNVPFIVLSGLWLWDNTNNMMAVVGPIGAWLTLFVGMLWGCRSNVVNLIASIKSRDNVIDELVSENQKLVGIIDETRDSK